MKFKCEKNILSQAIQITQRITPNKPVIQALSGLYLDINNNNCSVTATDLEISVRYTFNPTVIEEGKAVVSGRYLLDIIKNLPDSLIDIYVKENNLIIDNNKSRFILNTIPPDEFPKIQSTEENMVKIEKINSDIFIDGTDQTIRATAKDDSRPILTGVFFKIENGYLEIAATDGYRLGVFKIKNPAAPPLAGIVIPSRALDELMKIKNNFSSMDLEIVLSENHIKFIITAEDNNIELNSRLFEGNFPNYNQLIPDEFLYNIKVNKNELYNTIKRSSIIADGSHVRLDVKDGMLEVSSKNQGVGSSFEKIAINTNINDYTITFNPTFFLEGLSVIKGEEVVVEFNESNKPAIIKSDTDKNFFYMLMPIRTG